MFDPNKNYAAEIQAAIQRGASANEVSSLNAQRKEKISANQAHYDKLGISSGDGFGADAMLYASRETPSMPESHATVSPYTGGTASYTPAPAYNGNTDYASAIRTAVSSGAPVSQVQALLNARNAKISSDAGAYANKRIASDDSFSQMAKRYIAGNGAAPSSALGTNYTFDPSVDYQREINIAAASGDLARAARLEQQRNAKIAATGSAQAQTNNFSQYLNGAEASDLLQKYQTLAAQQAGTTSNGFTPNLDEYLKEQYRANTEAQLAALKTTYEQNSADLSANAAKIPQTYEAARNQAAAQNELSAKTFNEVAAAHGLNSGTSGQAALARASSLAGNLATVNSNQANALADNSLQQTKLAAQFRNAYDAAQASGNAAQAEALYKEYVRQTEAATAAANAAMSQSNQDKTFQFQQSESNRDQSNADRSYYAAIADSQIKSGITPDSYTLNKAGMNEGQAAQQAAIYRAQIGLSNAVKSARVAKTTSGGKSSRKASSKKKSSVNRSAGYTANTAATTAHKTDVVKNTGDRQASVNRTQSGYASLGKVAKSLYRQFQGSALTQENKAAMVKSAYKSKHITSKEANTLLDILGF